MMRRLLVSLALAAVLGAVHARVEAQEVLTLDQGRALAARSLAAGDPGMTLQLTGALLDADRRDGLAWYMRAAAYSQDGAPGEGHKSAGRAYRFARNPADKFAAAQLAARLALAEGRYSLAQIWLRRTAAHAPGTAAKEAIARDYKTLRRLNPWSFRLRGELKPSNNVNNGSDSAIEIIDGTPTAGSRLGPRAVALSGTAAIADASLHRRLRSSGRSETMLGGRLYLQRVALSGEAKAKAAEIVASRPGFTMPRNSDFAASYAEVSLTHAVAAGPEGQGGHASAGLAFARAWRGSEKSYDLLRLSGSRAWRLGPATDVKADASAEQRLDPKSRFHDASILSLGATLGRTLESGSRISLAMGLRDTDAEHVNASFGAASLRLGYRLGRRLGPVSLSSGLILGYSRYPEYIRTGDGLPLPGGRRDHSAYLDVNLFFEAYDYAGFAPMLRLRGGKLQSNHEHFDSTEVSVSLGIESTF